ncbi:MAG: glutamine--fructose-6-phosphate transaminase (isomerizing) [Clostridiales bacterium]|jgi:glucosamine--fructose-6-phosphate aminotransferase (isomerizing)|nr:glutamine--fructose-6-phosphate transaminase (isomerizing) [Clostridiales bacterium]
MCGIVGYVGKLQAAPVLLEGLAKLEYRGYDSSGIAVVRPDGIETVKAKGRLKNLQALTDDGKKLSGSTGIGHTRWATHGAPSDTNAHPHMSGQKKFAIVHNGIIENYLELKEFLIGRGFRFQSDTDTEVVAHLIEHYFSGSMTETLHKAVNKLKGSYALGVLYAGEPDRLYCARKDSPLVIGLSAGAGFVASDMPALLAHTRRFILLDDNETACIRADGFDIYNANNEPVEKEPFTAEWDVAAAEKDGFPHFMLKEIHEQPRALRQTLSPRLAASNVELHLKKLTREAFAAFDCLHIAACGSAYHAGIVGKYFIEKLCRIPVQVTLASEFRYCDPLIDDRTLTVIISQSGETADTLAALREAKRLGSAVLSIVNVVGSSIARESDDVLYTAAGPEISVATTKGYTTQVSALYLLGLYLAGIKETAAPKTLAAYAGALAELPALVERMIGDATPAVQLLASLFHGANDAYYIGRGTDYAAAMEGALKLKEISYIHAEAYAAGELKHGTISLIEKGSLVVALATDPALYPKIRSNITEVRTRGAVVFLVTDDKSGFFAGEYEYIVTLPDAEPAFSAVLSAAVMQLFGYYTAAAKGLDIDKPRNLAKSVTVE